MIKKCYLILLLNLIMKRVIAAITLFGLVFGLPFLCLAVTHTEGETSIMTLDVCSQGSSSTLDTAPAIIEPNEDMQYYIKAVDFTPKAMSFSPLVDTNCVYRPPQA